MGRGRIWDGGRPLVGVNEGSKKRSVKESFVFTLREKDFQNENDGRRKEKGKLGSISPKKRRKFWGLPVGKLGPSAGLVEIKFAPTQTKIRGPKQGLLRGRKTPVGPVQLFQTMPPTCGKRSGPKKKNPLQKKRARRKKDIKTENAGQIVVRKTTH